MIDEIPMDAESDWWTCGLLGLADQLCIPASLLARERHRLAPIDDLDPAVLLFLGVEAFRESYAEFLSALELEEMPAETPILPNPASPSTTRSLAR